MSEDVRTVFRGWADSWAAMGSPLMGRLGHALAEVLDETTETGRRILNWSGDFKGDAVPIRVTGGLNALRLAGEAPLLTPLYPPNDVPPPETFAAILKGALPKLDDALQPWLDDAPQTNEVGRAAVVMPALMQIAGTHKLSIRLFELGSSAGLNLRLDDYRYDFGGHIVGKDQAPLTLTPDWDGPTPAGDWPEITERRGVDVLPLDVTDPDARARLTAYCWPDQVQRVMRLEAALAVAATDPPPLDGEDAADWTERHVAPKAGTATVIFHTIAFQYFPKSSQARITAHLEHEGAQASPDAPLHWVRFEDDMVGTSLLPTLTVRSWPPGLGTGKPVHLATAHPHGSRITWHGSGGPRD
ncbi:MAG: DUF2332 domain-containing protein [Pacificimonas sp.]